MKPLKKILILSISALIFAMAHSADNSDEEGNVFEKADGELLWSILFLQSGSLHVHFTVAVTWLCATIAILGLVFQRPTLFT